VSIGAGGPRTVRPPARLGVPYAVGVSRSKRGSWDLLGEALAVLPWKPWRVRWLSGVLARLNLTGERERAREALVDWYAFAGDRERILGAVSSLLALFLISGSRPTVLALPRGSGSSPSSDKL
jgi:hypothetical protein